MRCEVHQLAAIEKRNDLHSRRQNVVIKFFDLLVDTLECRLRGRSFAQQHDARDDIVIVDNLAVVAVNRPRELP